MKRTYYSLEDLVISAVGAWNPTLNVGGEVKLSGTPLIEVLIQEFSGTTIPQDSKLKDSKANKLFCTYIAPRYKNTFVSFLDGTVASEDVTKEYADWILNFVVIFLRTFLKYDKMLTLYEDSKNKLLDEVKSFSESKFNDTPQNASSAQYDWSTDNHLTNITRVESGTDLDTVIARLDEVENNIKDYYTRWADEFGGLFIYD